MTDEDLETEAVNIIKSQQVKILTLTVQFLNNQADNAQLANQLKELADRLNNIEQQNAQFKTIKDTDNMAIFELEEWKKKYDEQKKVLIEVNQKYEECKKSKREFLEGKIELETAKNDSQIKVYDALKKIKELEKENIKLKNQGKEHELKCKTLKHQNEVIISDYEKSIFL